MSTCREQFKSEEGKNPSLNSYGVREILFHKSDHDLNAHEVSAKQRDSEVLLDQSVLNVGELMQ